MVEVLRTKYQFKELENGARPLLEIDSLSLSDFSIHDNAMISAVVKLSRIWDLSVINNGLRDLPFDEGLDNNWEIGFLYEGNLFQTIWLLSPIFDKLIDLWTPNEHVIGHLNLQQVNQLIPVLKQTLGRFDK